MTAALVLAALGCGTASEPGVRSAYATGSVGILHVDRFDVPLEGSQPLEEGRTFEEGRTALGAAFARYRGADARSVLELLGSAAVAIPETCTYVGADEPLRVDDAEVELLDVGTILVQVANTEARLAPRAFPDLASVVAGVVYAGDATLAVPSADVEYAFRAAGSADIPAFDAVALAPASIAELRVGGSAPTRSSAISRDVGLELTWAAGDPSDTIEFEIRAHGDALACAAIDDGSFRVDPESLAILAPDAGASLVLRRVRVSPVDVPGIDDSFARVTVSRTFPVELR
jgi:hypothetical protein